MSNLTSTKAYIGSEISAFRGSIGMSLIQTLGSSINWLLDKTGGTGLNYSLSSSCGSFSTASATPVDVTNLSVTLTTTGRPVYLTLISDATGNLSFTGASGSQSFFFIRDGSTIAYPSSAFNGYQPASALNFLDFPTAATHTYKLQASASYVQYAKLIAIEL